MLEETLVKLAEAGGTAVVSAAGTDAWNGLRQGIARWFGGGDSRRVEAELDRLDQTAAAVQVPGRSPTEQVRVLHRASWQARLVAALESMDASERADAAARLRGLLARYAPPAGLGDSAGGLAVGGDMHIRADGGSVAAGVIQGGVQLNPPHRPDPPQG